MNNPKAQQKIFESINGFFIRAIELKESEKLAAYFRFMKMVPNHSPFNNTLVFIQNPNCGYYATASQWEKRFGRVIKNDVRPMVILFPFWPVEFVYDIDDTEGEPITDENIISWWRENGGTFDDKIMENTFRILEWLGIRWHKPDPSEYFENHTLRVGGFARYTYSTGEFDIALHPRYSEFSLESYWILCHEIAHILLGHLGSVVWPPDKKSSNWKEISKNRCHVPDNIMELEAELVAWIVFNSLGIEKNSESYIAMWMNNPDDFRRLEMSEVLRVAGKIQDMGKGIPIYRKQAKATP